jgi:hypothetical protein
MSMKNSRQYDYEKQQQKTASAAINVAQLVKIIAYDPAKMTVDVQPISKRLDQGSYESQPPILSVPVSCQRGGGFAMRVNYKPGDVGSVIFCDHDIDNAVAGGAEGEPNTERNHSSSDAVFMGGIATGGGGVSGLPDGHALTELILQMYGLYLEGEATAMMRRYAQKIKVTNMREVI